MRIPGRCLAVIAISVSVLAGCGQQETPIPEPNKPTAGTVPLSSTLDRQKELVTGALQVRADEGVIIDLRN